MNNKLNSIIQGTFEIDLVEIELRKGETCITGKGIIYQKKEELHLKFFNDLPVDERNKIEEFINSVNKPDKVKILQEDDYYTLLGKDQYGNTYHGKVLAHFIASEIITGKLSSDLIKTKTEQINPESNTLEIYINDNKPIPLNDRKNTRVSYGKSEIQYFDTFDDAWFFNVLDKYKIQVQRNIRYQKVLIGTEFEITEDEIDKLLDSLRFVFGRYFDWFYINYNFCSKEKFHLRRNSDNVNTIFVPPLKINNSYNTDYYEKLFNCYYTYLSTGNTQPENLNFYVRKTIIAGYAYLGAFELVLATSIEGILKLFPTKTNIDKNHIEKVNNDIERIKKLFNYETFEKNNEVVNNIHELLKSIQRSNSKETLTDAKDILKEFIAKSKIDAKYKNSYKEFRNRLAHADIPVSDPIKRINNLNEILDLFYQLIFLRIGYNGKYTSYFNSKSEDFTHNI